MTNGVRLHSRLKAKNCETCGVEYMPEHGFDTYRWAMRRFCGNGCAKKKQKQERAVTGNRMVPKKPK